MGWHQKHIFFLNLEINPFIRPVTAEEFRGESKIPANSSMIQRQDNPTSYFMVLNLSIARRELFLNADLALPIREFTSFSEVGSISPINSEL